MGPGPFGSIKKNRVKGNEARLVDKIIRYSGGHLINRQPATNYAGPKPPHLGYSIFLYIENKKHKKKKELLRLRLTLTIDEWFFFFFHFKASLGYPKKSKTRVFPHRSPTHFNTSIISNSGLSLFWDNVEASRNHNCLLHIIIGFYLLVRVNGPCCIYSMSCRGSRPTYYTRQFIKQMGPAHILYNLSTKRAQPIDSMGPFQSTVQSIYSRVTAIRFRVFFFQNLIEHKCKTLPSLSLQKIDRSRNNSLAQVNIVHSITS